MSGAGVSFLISQFTNISIFAIFWPLIIIAIGVSILLKPSKDNWSKSETFKDDSINQSLMMWGADWKVTSKNFKGGKIDVLLGGFQAEKLRDAEISQEWSQEIKFKLSIRWRGSFCIRRYEN